MNLQTSHDDDEKSYDLVLMEYDVCADLNLLFHKLCWNTLYKMTVKTLQMLQFQLIMSIFFLPLCNLVKQ